MQLKFAPRYAKALIDISIEQSNLYQVYTDMKVVRDSILRSDELHSLLKSPIISGDKKWNVISAIFTTISDLTKIFIQTTINKKREQHLLEITKEFVDQYDAINHIIKAKITSAEPLTENVLAQMRATIKSQLNANDVEIHTTIDKDLIGGFVLEYNDKIFDASILYDLKHIAKQFADNEYVAKL